MMCAYSSGRLILVLLFLFCIPEDLAKRSVDLRIFLAAAAAEISWYLVFFMKGGTVRLPEIAAGAAVGVFLLLVSKLTRGAVGSGDACFFLLTGAGAGLRNNLTLLTASLFFSAFASLVLVSAGILRNRSVKNLRLPFIPFTLLPALFLFLGS